ncbi:MAG: AgmX/PglI C-terminal domain-containing protein [Myxococcales bacterium]
MAKSQPGSLDGATSYAVGTDSKGNVVVAGQTHAALSGQVEFGAGDAFVRKYDAAGNELWTRQFGTSAPDCVLALSVDSAGNVLVVGVTEATPPGQAYAGEPGTFVRKFDAAGKELWTRAIGTVSGAQGLVAAVSSNGSVTLTGAAASPGREAGADRDDFVRQYNSGGNELWGAKIASGETARTPPLSSAPVGGEPLPNPYAATSEDRIDEGVAHSMESVRKRLNETSTAVTAEADARAKVRERRRAERERRREEREEGRQWACAGDLSANEILKVLNESRSAVRSCYERMLRADGPQQQGRVRLRVKIGNDGAVAATQVSGEVDDQEVRNCIQSVASHWSFPAPKGDSCAVFDAPYSFVMKN